MGKKQTNQPLKTTKQGTRSAKTRLKKRNIIIIFCLLTLLGIATGYVQYGMSYIGCGNAPYIVKYSPFSGGTAFYDSPTSATYLSYDPLAFGRKYYCSEEQVKAENIQPSIDESYYQESR
jgi:hypothetical protein